MGNPRKQAVALVAVFLLGLTFRLIFIRYLGRPPANDLLWNDAVGWNLASGRGFTASQELPYVPGIFRSPGYPAFLAIIYALYGHSFYAAFVGQCVLDSLTAVLLTLTVRNLAQVGVALLAGLIYALYPYSAFFCGNLSQDILLTFMVGLVLYLIPTDREAGAGASRWLLIGVAMGVATLVKPFIILYAIVPAVSLYRSTETRRSKVQAAAALILGMATVISPWVARNYLTFHAFPPLAAGGTGTNLMYLVKELDGGEKELVSGFRVPVSGGEAARDYLRTFQDGTSLIVEEKRLAEQAVPEILARWPAYFLLVLRHIPRLWVSLYAIGQSRTMALAGLGISIVYLASGICGIFLVRQEWRRLIPLLATIILITVIYAPYTAEARYTLPARPALVAFVGFAVGALVKRFRFMRYLEDATA